MRGGLKTNSCSRNGSAAMIHAQSLFPAASQPANQPAREMQQLTLRAVKALAQVAGSVPPSSFFSKVREVRRHPSTCPPSLGCPGCCAADLAAAAAGGEPEPEPEAEPEAMRRVRAARRPSPHAAGSAPVSRFSDRSSTVSRLHQQWHQRRGQGRWEDRSGAATRHYPELQRAHAYGKAHDKMHAMRRTSAGRREPPNRGAACPSGPVQPTAAAGRAGPPAGR